MHGRVMSHHAQARQRTTATSLPREADDRHQVTTMSFSPTAHSHNSTYLHRPYGYLLHSAHTDHPQ